jgi:hypothetical protein
MYRKRPVVVEAVQMTTQFAVQTLEGEMFGGPGDWLLIGTDGEQYPCDDQTFRQTYDEVGVPLVQGNVTVKADLTVTSALDTREEANHITAACVRNNTPLEDIHARGSITDEEMRELMIAISSNVAEVLTVRELLPRDVYLRALPVMGMGTARDWDTETRSGGLCAWFGLFEGLSETQQPR